MNCFFTVCSLTEHAYAFNFGKQIYVLFRLTDAIILQADVIKCHKTFSGGFVVSFLKNVSLGCVLLLGLIEWNDVCNINKKERYVQSPIVRIADWFCVDRCYKPVLFLLEFLEG